MRGRLCIGTFLCLLVWHQVLSDVEVDQNVTLATTLEPQPVQEEVTDRPNEHTTALNILDSLLQHYDRRATPTNHLGKATVVDCKLYVRSLGSINPDTMDYQVDLYLRQHWFDPRLNHPQLNEPLDLNDPNLVKGIWKPEVYFPNAKDAEFQYVTVPNVLVRINPGGNILYMLRLKLKFSCMMELSKFPLDEQVCTMEIASFSKTTKELILQWKDESAVDISNEVKMPQFEIFKVIAAKCQETFHIGNYSCLLAELHLKRSLGFHMVQSYLPTILIVVISWVSFWMDVDSVAGRTTLGVTTLLTVSSKASDVQAEVPLVSYVKAIDIWMGACTGFIFAALLEFTFTNYLWRRGRRGHTSRHFNKENQLSKSIRTPSPPSFSENGGRGELGLHQVRRRPNGENEPADNECGEPNGNIQTEVISRGAGEFVRVLLRDEDLGREEFADRGRNSNTYHDMSDCILAINIDEWSRTVFPFMFFLFNVCYWTYYSHWNVH
ncbi:hypothetical protein TCAL_04085 [Tigriopus californicus]|uniref:Ig-like domain-containing protein n=1 Tax=Tigriopus californicus TaxID=6832 RepID=A0A553NSY8_TIGCA|nr:glycine receptor subunit alpha-4-like [Tigriopus californicus]TRY68555.1 hypothetical protein TCAL_04085 [Tigriopus californicus]